MALGTAAARRLAFIGAFVLLAGGAGARTDCRAACGDTIRACMTETGHGRERCAARVRRRCRKHGLHVCSPTMLPAAEGSCVNGIAPACGGSCPMPQFSCVPDGNGSCGCEAPACGRARDSECTLGVCPNAGQACVLRRGRCRCV